MSKSCPKCGTQTPDDAKFCGSCGYNFEAAAGSKNSSIFKNGKIFLILIAAVVIIGAAFILTSEPGGNDSSGNADDAKHVDLTISEVSGWQSDSGKKSYTLYTEALFNKVPSDLKGYLIKTTYYDENDTKIGHETEKLQNVYYDSDYEISFGFYDTYTKPNPDHVKVEIIKDGNVIDRYTEKIDKNKIEFLN
ncbi:zinc ribbon domain-containing protein [Methanobrevibacter sp.]|uniref:zinc ribbon domain-containing protein n=1 Tax=Methanobrevibacter sp. TaxID=66852 RepID=UPI00388DC5A9